MKLDNKYAIISNEVSWFIFLLLKSNITLQYENIIESFFFLFFEKSI